MIAPGGRLLTSVLGLDVSLTVGFLLVALVVLLWGFDRYRRTFARRELRIAVLIAAGILTLGVFPDVFLVVADVLNLDQTFRAVQIVANVAFIFLLLYVLATADDNRASVDALARTLTVELADDEDAVPDRSVYVVIPAYNESETLAAVLRSLPESVLGYTVRVVVVSDGSRDDTAAVARENGAIVVEHPINQGQGGALKTGFEVARRHDADVVVTIDADGQHPTDQIADLVAPIANDEADYVLGSRYRGRDESDNSIARHGGIRVFTWMVNRLARTDITDCTNGFRAIRGAALDALTLTEQRFSAPELLIEARKNGLRITEVPVTIHERGGGETKKPSVGYAVGLARTIFVTWIR